MTEQGEPLVPCTSMPRPRSVVAAVVLAGAVVLWLLSGGFVGHYRGRVGPSTTHGAPADVGAAHVVAVAVVAVAVAIAMVTVLVWTWGAVQACRGHGRVLTFAARLYLAVAVLGTVATMSDHQNLIQDVVVIVLAGAILVCQRRPESKAYYAAIAHDRLRAPV